MDTSLKTSIWQQFGAAIDLLDITVSACPGELWTAALWLTPDAKPERAQFWYVVYHTLFWLDLYLTGAEEGFLPPAPFTLIEQDGDDPLPERVYTKAELQHYLGDCRARCHSDHRGADRRNGAATLPVCMGRMQFLRTVDLQPAPRAGARRSVEHAAGANRGSAAELGGSS